MWSPNDGFAICRQDAGGLMPAKDDNAAPRHLAPELLPDILMIAM